MNEVDLNDLIAAVRSRPVLWNIEDQNYGNKQLAILAWDEVCERFYPDFNERNSQMKNKIKDLIKTKWKNVRDTFVKLFKTGFSQGTWKYDESTMFLKEMYIAKQEGSVTKSKLSASSSKDQNWRIKYKSTEGQRLSTGEKSMDRTDEVQNENASKCKRNLRHKVTPSYEEPPSSSDSDNKDLPGEKSDLRPKKRLSLSCNSESVSSPTIVEMTDMTDDNNSIDSSVLVPESTNQVQAYPSANVPILPFTVNPNNMDEDIAFFRSLFSLIKQFNDDEKLEFRAEVMKLIQRIRNQDSSRNFYVIS